MLNELGEVVGMISMRALFGEGIGFAIPVDTLKSALPYLLKRAKVPRPYLGLKFIVPEYGRKLDGALVGTVLPGSPAAHSGFQTNDLIVEVDRQRVHCFEDVQHAVLHAGIGQQISFRVKRESDVLKLTMATSDVCRLFEETEKMQRDAPRRVVILR